MGKPFKITLIDHEWDDLKIEAGMHTKTNEKECSN